ncbi:ATPase domain-containing protein [cf. Phormidesmis sp. LEGE 11477]|uniref:ATPase domain-containing protein n=1 Tax=cf. Phormidesmis sp. LEGE 11477 TaxID=1828680 RepID=UPI001881FA21|nr:ATPase domain-containing protein [cf. Phormidesmis sp. LEGE 11477]MBE9059552.1 AAA family ATPase [cf. Phormidesmis sp. LEGE 11477]
MPAKTKIDSDQTEGSLAGPLENSTVQTRLPTGVPGLDDVLKGGLIPGQAYLLRGGTGAGKTTLGLHFLTQANQSEPALFITLGEVESKIRRNAANLGFDLAHIHFLDLSPAADFFTEDKSYDIFSSADVERESVTQQIITSVQDIQPNRIFVDSITQFRYLSSDHYQFHQQVLSFIRYLTDEGATTIFTSESSDYIRDDDLKFLSDGVISLQATAEDRTVEVEKFRGSDFIEGKHSLKIKSAGIQVFPQLKPDTFGRGALMKQVSSGVPEIDQLLHGGIESGTVTIVSGPTGVGKTSFGTQFMKEAAGRGVRSVLYSFEESVDMILHRCEGINMPAKAMVDNGTLLVESVEAMSMSPDEFAQKVRREVEIAGAKIIMIDGLAGYRLSMWGTNANSHIHALCRYLRNMSVTTLLIDEVGTVTGEFKATGQPLSYLADTLIFLRYLEVEGELRKAIGVLKKRLSSFETTLREFEITRYGLKVGDPLVNLRGILRGIPEGTTPESAFRTDS